MYNWISVKDRLPDKVGKYLTYSNKNCMVTVKNFLANNIYSENKEEHKLRFIVSNGKDDKNITHWMPFPDPPKDIDPV